ncbi:MAG: VWA-like domain-containing protein [Anaeroplasma sp.]|uniref:vWA domain-containing protein n=1 Tax=Anaeroplasma sp. TaxID=1872523 RepID=UPI002A91B850|nr:VWA-like domain-containing protein [Anaeroplasma sp.]MDY5983035.1 VWA-like domain-containing protein [Anaeroplasma sp.]
MQSSMKEYQRRLLLARIRILTNYGFYGIMLENMAFGLDPGCDTAYTDGEKICFSPKFMESLSDNELDFVLMHEVMHVALKHCNRGLKYNQELFNIACDIVVNSNILKSKGMNLDAIKVNGNISMHQIEGKEGYLFTAEEVYEKLLKNGNIIPSLGFDDHSKWEMDKEREDDVNAKIIAIKDMEDRAHQNGKPGVGSIPVGVERLVKELKESRVNWRELLNEFIEFEINDYTLLPPDRRYDAEFFMPSFSEMDENLEDVLFMVDTSGSMSIEDITLVYSEINGAIQAFDGRLKGLIGFFDAKVYEPISFDSSIDLTKIIPKGGGGTSFHNVFRYVMQMENKPKYLIILTDGYASFPKEEEKGNIPLLWLLTNDEVKPPYGKVAIMKK